MSKHSRLIEKHRKAAARKTEQDKKQAKYAAQNAEARRLAAIHGISPTAAAKLARRGGLELKRN